MPVPTLVGLKLRLHIADPWDYSHLSGRNAISDTVEAESGIALLLRLDDSLDVGGVACDLMVCSPRHNRPFSPNLLRLEEVPCNGTAIPPEHAAHPFDLGWWRGGGAVIGSIRRG